MKQKAGTTTRVLTYHNNTHTYMSFKGFACYNTDSFILKLCLSFYLKGGTPCSHRKKSFGVGQRGQESYTTEAGTSPS